MKIRLSVSLLALLFAAAAALPADEKTPAAKKPDKNKVIAIVGADIYTVTREVIRAGTVLIQDGKILRVGQDIPLFDEQTLRLLPAKH